jgi:hypothetical protein
MPWHVIHWSEADDAVCFTIYSLDNTVAVTVVTEEQSDDGMEV